MKQVKGKYNRVISASVIGFLLGFAVMRIIKYYII